MVLSVCLELSSEYSTFSSGADFEQCYQKAIKPLLSFLYAHPKFKMTLGFSGSQLEFFSDSHPEVLQLLSHLTGRAQVEILGGGYYSPIFPLLFPSDRSGQIEKMNAAVRSMTGKRPRGMSLFASVWDSSLVSTIHSCGIEYVHLSGSLISSSKRTYLPLIASELGKSIKILPVFNDLKPAEGESGADWETRVTKAVKGGTFPVLALSFTPDELGPFMDSPVFSYLSELSEKDDGGIRLSVPQEYLKSARDFTAAYIPAGMDWSIAQWARKPFVKSEGKSSFSLTIYDFLNTYSSCRKLYERMMYISMLIAQTHGGDKIRKKAACEKLWEAQRGENYVNLTLGLPADASFRQSAYRSLNEAERLLRECKPFKESLTCYDYNGDGLNEYIFQMEQYNAVVSCTGGLISNFNIMRSGGDYAANLWRMEQFDGEQDNFQRGLFVEHLLDAEQLKKYVSSGTVDTGIFSRVRFEEKKFNARRKEIHLEGRTEFSALNLPVSLRKNYIAFSGGFSVQYILKNEGPLPLKAQFVAELNLCKELLSAVLIENGNRKEISAGTGYRTSGGVSLVQITDSADKTLFVVEPNEAGGFACSDIAFRRPAADGEVRETSHTLAAALYWPVDLAAGMEMEKTLNFSIIPTRIKSSRNTNKKS